MKLAHEILFKFLTNKQISILLILIVLLGILYSCVFDSTKELQLVRKSTFFLYPDTTTSVFSNNIQRHTFHEYEVVSICNPIKSQIIVFALQNGAELYKIDLEDDGPHSVGRAQDELSHSFLNDSTLHIFNYARQTLYELRLIGNSYKINKKCIIPLDSSMTISVPLVNTFKPIVNFNRNVLLSGLLIGIEDIPASLKVKNMIELDLSQCKYRSGLERPKVYEQGNFGIEAGYQVYHTVNPKEKLIYFSFGIDPLVYALGGC